MEAVPERPITLGSIKGVWPFVLLLIGMGVNLFMGGMMWATMNSKLDNVIVAQKETNEVAKTLTVIVNDHESRLALSEFKMDACYNVCVAPGTRQSSMTQNKSQTFAQNSEESNRVSPSTRMSVKAESKSSSEEKASSQQPSAPEEKGGVLEKVIEKVPKVKDIDLNLKNL